MNYKNSITGFEKTQSKSNVYLFTNLRSDVEGFNIEMNYSDKTATLIFKDTQNYIKYSMEETENGYYRFGNIIEQSQHKSCFDRYVCVAGCVSIGLMMASADGSAPFADAAAAAFVATCANDCAENNPC